MSIEFKLPQLGEGVDEADVSRILVAEGDEIEAEQNVMELETEKAVADLPCPHAGKVVKIHVSEGDTVEVGQTLMTLEEERQEAEQQEGEEQEDAEGTEEQGQEQEKTEGTEEQGQEQEKTEGTEKQGQEQEKTEGTEEQEPARGEQEERREDVSEPQRASRERAEARSKERKVERDVPLPAGPATRRLARSLGVDLEEVVADDGGRIRQEDVVRAHVENGKAAFLARRELPDFEQFGPVQRQSLGRIAATSAERLAGSWRTVPHVTQHGWADITEIDAARREFLARSGDERPKITMTALALKAVVGLLKRFPRFNASLDVENQELVLKHFFHIGIAVDTDRGLLVPVVRDADRLSLLGIAAAIERLADRARGRELTRDDMSGGTFTISNQGGIGGGHFTPIVDWPQVAILGIGRARASLEPGEGGPTERLRLPLSLSYDHRAINGADAARFVTALEDSLSGTFELLAAT